MEIKIILVGENEMKYKKGGSIHNYHSWVVVVGKRKSARSIQKYMVGVENL